MRILHVGKYYHPHAGGMETVLRNITEGLLQGGDEVAVLAAGGDTLPSRMELRVPGAGHTGRLYLTACPGNWFSQPLTWDLVHALRRTTWEFRPDVVHLHLPNPLAAAAWLAFRGMRSGPEPTLAIWHHADMQRQKVGKVLLRPVVRACLQRAAGICVSSRSLAGMSRELAGLESRVGVIPFGIDPPEPVAGSGTADGPFLFVGRLVDYKGVDVLLRAVARVPQAELDIVGTGPREGSLRDLARGLELSGRVRFQGRLSDRERSLLLSRARALVLPSLDASETFGLVQLEAMAAGTAVIVSDLPTGVAEVGRAGRTALVVPPGDVDALAHALSRLQDDAGLARALGAAGKERYLDRFTRRRMVASLRRWYEGLLGQTT